MATRNKILDEIDRPKNRRTNQISRSEHCLCRGVGVSGDGVTT